MTNARQLKNPNDFIITRKRKQYKFALFHNSPICFEMEEFSGPKTDVLEIGAGTGLFSVGLAELHKNTHYVAVDVKADRLITGAREAETKQLSNVQFVRSRADLLPELFTPHSIETIWVTFPDPFPKKGSAGRRLLHPHFLTRYQMLLRPTGALYFKTDAHNLFEWSLEQLVREGWRIEELTFDLHESNYSNDYKILTSYERRFTGEGLNTHFVKATPPATINV